MMDEGIEANAVSIRIFKASSRAALPVRIKRIKQLVANQYIRPANFAGVIEFVRNPYRVMRR